MKRIIKYLLSFFKTKWDLNDYPIEYVRNRPIKGLERFKPIPWTASILTWPKMHANGHTKEEAYRNLQSKFDLRGEEGDHFPRPGAGPGIDLAPRAGVEEFEDIMEHFMQEIFGFAPDQYIITDLSRLSDFCGEYSGFTLEDLHQRIKEVYNADVSDLEDGYMVEIFKRLSIVGKLPDDSSDP